MGVCFRCRCCCGLRMPRPLQNAFCMKGLDCHPATSGSRLELPCKPSTAQQEAADGQICRQLCTAPAQFGMGHTMSFHATKRGQQSGEQHLPCRLNWRCALPSNRFLKRKVSYWVMFYHILPRPRAGIPYLTREFTSMAWQYTPSIPPSCRPKTRGTPVLRNARKDLWSIMNNVHNSTQYRYRSTDTKVRYR